MVGANDYVPAFRAVARGTRPARTYHQIEERVAANLTAVINTIRALHTNPDEVHIALLDYWNVVKDGAVAARVYTHREREAAAQATESANRAIAHVAAATGAIDVSTFDPFENPKVNLTSLLAPDGDHPSAAGHHLIATVLFQALPRG
jgi:lysophospholipase L1-like esterase